MRKNTEKVAVVIPSYKVAAHIKAVLSSIPPMVWRVYVVDDSCPDKTGKLVESTVSDERVRVIYHSENQGVGGAVMTGYQQAISDGADIIVKIDGDGQMEPALVPCFIDPILSGHADYTKGNRFYDLENIREMPPVRLFGNAVLSLMTKLSSGYWDLFDPTNGYTAIHTDVARHLPFHKISRRYFFETDILFRLNTLRAVVVDVPMDAKYAGEISNLRSSKVLGEFLRKHCRNLCKRIFYNYYLRDMSLASLELPIGFFLLSFGVIFGATQWLQSIESNVTTPTGTVMLSVLPVIMGVQFIMGFINHDVSSVPSRVYHRSARALDKRMGDQSVLSLLKYTQNTEKDKSKNTQEKNKAGIS